MVAAQSFEVTGRVLTEEGKQPLDAATVYIESVRDSSLITYAITNSTGEFLLEGKTRQKEFRLLVSYTGYEGQQRLLSFKRSQRIPDILLKEQAVSLRQVSVTGDRVPIRIKQDTLEFNADSFRTRPDATVEDVLKQLPGVEIDSDGTITVNGKEVNQVLVNGQVFFSTDPKVATKSLPKDIISKIQITNTKTREQEFSGDEGDGETKTINLTIKEDKNKGYLGRLSGGYGTEERYQANGLVNYFANKTRASILGSSNNINNSGFSFDEVFDLVGGFGGGNVNFGSGGSINFGFGRGITTSSTLGGSFADEKDDLYELSTNYFWSNSDNFNEERTARENILPDRRFFTDSESDFEGSTESHRASAELEFEIADGFEISLEPTCSSALRNPYRRTTRFLPMSWGSSLTATARKPLQQPYKGDSTTKLNCSNVPIPWAVICGFLSVEVLMKVGQKTCRNPCRKPLGTILLRNALIS